jgi:Fe-S cluster assembly scaffold protein SufB
VCSDIDHEAAFYLQSRGISSREARRLLLKSFILDAMKGYTMVMKLAQYYGWYWK